jgi:hypothetical protein
MVKQKNDDMGLTEVRDAHDAKRDAERDPVRDAERDAERDPVRDAERDAERDPVRDAERDEMHDIMISLPELRTEGYVDGQIVPSNTTQIMPELPE